MQAGRAAGTGSSSLTCVQCLSFLCISVSNVFLTAWLFFPCRPPWPPHARCRLAANSRAGAAGGGDSGACCELQMMMMMMMMMRKTHSTHGKVKRTNALPGKPSVKSTVHKEDSLEHVAWAAHHAYRFFHNTPCYKNHDLEKDYSCLCE